MTHYVTFEQAKKLKALNFNEKCRNYYTPIGKEYQNGWGDTIENPSGFSTNEHNELNEFDYSDFNKKQKDDYCLAPEHWQVVDWLLDGHGIWVAIEPYITNSKPRYEYKIMNVSGVTEEDWVQEEYHTPHEALSSAFDYILDNLI
jgi:hypothetical protein